MVPTQKKDKMFDLIHQWEESGLNRKTFCRKHNLNLSQFSYWRTKYLKEQSGKEKESDEVFIPVKPATDSTLEIKYPNGVVIRVPENTSTGQLQTLINLL